MAVSVPVPAANDTDLRRSGAGMGVVAPAGADIKPEESQDNAGKEIKVGFNHFIGQPRI